MSKMVYSDFKVRGEKKNQMEIIALGAVSDRENTCPKLDTCKYAKRVKD